MFTGIVTSVGEVRSVDPVGAGQDMRLTIGHPGWPDPPALGASIACSGCCLTAVATGADWFAVEVSAETLAHTTLGAWRAGTPVNLERALRVGDELGGHIVSGHVDGLGEAMLRVPENGSTRFRFRLDPALARFVATKGSIAINGVSLTVNEVDATSFGVNIIPHTIAHTNLHAVHPGDCVNIEIDTLARYVARLAETVPSGIPGNP